MSTSKVGSAALLKDGDLSKSGTEGGKEKDDSSSGRPDRSVSPEVAKCAICLGDVVNRSCSNACAHQFCFGCLLEWSKVKPECPLCKCSFRSIYHNFRSNNEYDEYNVPTPVPHLSIRFTASGTNYRLSPFIRVLEARAGHQHSPLGHAFEGVSIPAGMFPPPPPPPPVVLSTNPFNNGTSGVRPEFFGDFINEHRRVQEEAIQMPGYQNRRRRYDRNDWVQPFGSTLQPGSVIFPSVEYIRTHPAAINRLRNWLYRELNVLLGLYRSRDQMAFVYDLIMHLINHYDVRSRDFRDMVNTYFQTKTAHFQHELYHFILSGMSMEEYDRVAEYPSTSGNNSTRRNAAPEVITLDSEEEEVPNHIPARQPRTDENSDIILLDSSSSDEDDRPSLLAVTPNVSERSYAHVVSGNSTSTIDFSRMAPLSLGSTIPMPDLSAGIEDSSDRVGDREGARRHMGRVVNRDPEMPVLEPQVYPFVPVENYSYGGENTTIDRSRATAATTTVTSNNVLSVLSPETVNQNLTRPSVLSSSSGRIQRSVDDLVRLIEPEFDIDLNVSVESYSSPPRQASRPLASPDFPILQLRRNMVDRDRDMWERTSRITTVPNSGVCPFAGFGSSSSRSNSRGNDSASAFVPYEPESSHGVREEIARPPRPSCIHGTGSGSIGTGNHLSSSSSTSGDYRSISSAPAFRIDLYPRGISSSQVMDLSRSAGLISTASSSRATATSPSPTSSGCPPALVASSLTPPLTSHLAAVAGPSSSLTSHFSVRGNQAEKRLKTDKAEGDEQSDSDELECLGSFPIEKKPPLAVITLSSDDEEESRIKAESKRERLNILSSDDESNLLDGFIHWASQPLSSDFNLLDVDVPSSPPVIDFQSSSSSSSFLPVVPPHQTTNSSSGSRTSSTVISLPAIPSFRLTIRNNSVQNSGESGANREPTASSSGSSERHKKKRKHSSPKKSKRRARVLSNTEDSSDNEDQPPKSVQSSSTSSPAKIPKKRKYPEIQASPEVPSLSTSESSEGSGVSTFTDDDDDSDFDVDVFDYAKPKSKTKKRSSPKKKHKSKSKKSKKSKKGKDKEKSKSSKKRSASKVKTSGSDASSATFDVTASSSGTGGSSSSSSRHSHTKTKKDNAESSSSGGASKSTVQAPTTTSSSASFSLSTPVMNMPICDFEYPSGLLDLSFNNRTEDDAPLLPAIDDENTIDLRIPPPPPPAVIEPSSLSSTVDTSAIFGSPSRTIFNAFWDDYSSSSSVADRRNGGWME